MSARLSSVISKSARRARARSTNKNCAGFGRQRRRFDDVFGLQFERAPRSRHDFQMRRAFEQIAHDMGGVGDLFEIVQNQQRLLVFQQARDLLACAVGGVWIQKLSA